eukprot:4636823-Pyramimonas_sp.AAC.2
MTPKRERNRKALQSPMQQGEERAWSQATWSNEGERGARRRAITYTGSSLYNSRLLVPETITRVDLFTCTSGTRHAE